MTEKNKKQKFNVQVLMLFKKKDSLLFFAYESNHHKRIDIDEFKIGKLRLFRKDKVYNAQLKSKPYLNPSLVWTGQTFQVMIKKFDEFVIQQQTIDFSQQISISLFIKIKGRQINLLKIKLTEQFGIDLQNQLWNEFKRYNDFKTKDFNRLQITIKDLSDTISVTLDRLQKVQKDQIQKVNQVKIKLSALMCEKQKKIRQLSGNHHYQWTNDEQNNKNQLKSQSFQPSISNWMSSQEDRVLVGSLFAPSQDFLI